MILMYTLKIGAGILWSLAYVLIIRRGFKDHAFGMPLAAVCCNSSWEFLYAFLDPPRLFVEELIVCSWFFMSVIMLSQAIMFRRCDYKRSPDVVYYGMIVVFYVINITALTVFRAEIKNLVVFSAYGLGINVIMSAAFIAMIVRRRNLAGQSIAIALLKLAGTLFGFLYGHFFVVQSPLVAGIYAVIFILDVIYAALLVRTHLTNNVGFLRA